MVDRKLKIPRDVLMTVFNGDLQAVKAMEGLQLSAFDLLPKDIQQIIETAAADAQQASMIANQIRQSLAPYLAAVSVPIATNTALQAVSVSIDGQDTLQAVNAGCDCPQALQAV